MGGSVVAIAAQLMEAGHDVEIIDFNIDETGDQRVIELLASADTIGVSVMGSPSIPGALEFTNRMLSEHPEKKLILGGQVISHFSADQFRQVFGLKAIQMANEHDLGQMFGSLPAPYEVSFQNVWERMGDQRLRVYLSHEFALVLSQGCIYTCAFCSAQKGQKETFRNLSTFRNDLLYLLQKARQFGIPRIECYASSLDFFQTSKIVSQYMETMAQVQEETGVKVSTRCLTCMNTFLAASRQLPNFPDLVNRSGLWCLGFGVDGPTEEVWQEQHKAQNRMDDVSLCYNLCQQIGVRAEVLTVMGYPADSPKRLWQTIRHLSGFVRRWPNTVLRPYVAREVLPGNDGWGTQTLVVEKLVANPNQFYNLDICGLANHTTHPDSRWQRWLVNLAYLWVICRYGPFGRCATSPLLPQGEPGLYGRFAKLVNQYMPFDR
jgi:hypothetical protein